MSNFVPLETLDRRSLIRTIALGLTASGTLDVEAAQHVHSETVAEKAKGPYKVKTFTAGEYKTLQRLAVLIVPADSVSGSALDAGAPEFIDTLASQNEQIADIFHGGLAWLDAEMRKRYNATFVAAKPEQQTQMLDALVEAGRELAERQSEELVYQKSPIYKDFTGYTVRRANELGAGVAFFDWVRKMTVDAFYTSPIGFKDLNYIGNRALSRYTVPKEAMDYAMKRSPFA
jgi:gluconate 2-dehydrogenase gamma chain